MSAVCDVFLWKKPTIAALVLAVGTLIFYHCHVLDRPIVALLADTLLVLACAAGTLGILSRHFKFQPPIDPLSYQLSPETATMIVSCVANLAGAAESVLRVAASGKDYRLFAKVATFFYFASVLGRMCSGTVAVYSALWAMFIIPYIASRVYPEQSYPCPQQTCRLRFPRKSALTAALRNIS